MMKTAHQIIERYLARLLFFWLLTGLAVPGWFVHVSAGQVETIQTKNAAGNLNLPPSVDPIGKNVGFSTVLYDNRNGLPTSEANAIAQTGDGFIWIGSYAGLIRYDGNTFERIDSTTGISNVRSLYVDSLDRLWIGTNDAGVFLMSEGEIRNWNKSSGLESVSIRNFLEDENGIMYVGSTTGMAMIDPDLHLTLLTDERLQEQIIRSLRIGPDHLIYGLTQNGDLFTVKDGAVLSFLSHEECRVKGILAILPDPENPGALYLGTEESQVYYGFYEDNFSVLGVKKVSSLNYLETFEYIDGDIWISAGNGIGRLDDTGFHTLNNVPMNSSVGDIMTDYEGNLWFTSTRQGIMKIVPNRFSDLFERYDLPAQIVNTTCMYHGQLFIGTDAGLLVTENGRKLDEIPLTQEVSTWGTGKPTDNLLTYLEGVRIRTLLIDSQDRLWIATWRKQGLLCYDNGKLTVFTQEDGLYSHQIRALWECEDQTILAANTGGVSLIKDGRVVGGYGEKEGIINTEILTVTEGFRQEIILGSDGGGIYVIRDGEVRQIGVEKGLQSEVILRIKPDQKRKIYWIVTSNSLAYMTADYQVTTVREFPYSNNYDLFGNEKGDLWILSSNGIYVVSAEKMLENQAIEPIFYGIRSGLPYMPTANSYSHLTKEGDLYIACTTGVVSVNIENSFDNIKDLKVAVPYIDADGKRYYSNEEGDFLLPDKARKLTVYPYVFNYALVDPQISYRLVGFDTEDVTVSRSRLGPISYTNLGRGTFIFVMTIQDPVEHSEYAVSYRLVKGKKMSAGMAGSLIMAAASLLLLGGTLLYTSPYRRRNRIEDRLLLIMALSIMVLALGELLSCLMEYRAVPLGRQLMIAGQTIYYMFYVIFPYLLLVYVDYCSNPERVRLRRTKLLYGIPCLVFLAIVMINLKTGWIFSVGEGNELLTGEHGIFLSTLPAWFYLVVSLIKVYKVSPVLTLAGLVLAAGRGVGEYCFPDISAASFFYTLVLVCNYLYVMNQPMNEVAL